MLSNPKAAAPDADGAAARALAPMSTVSPPPGKKRLGEVASLAYDCIQSAIGQGGDDFSALNGFDECIHVKNSAGVLVYVNDAHRRLFSPTASPIGRTCEAFLDPVIATHVQRLDELIREGCCYIECEHSGPGPDGSVYRMHSLKCSLMSLSAPGIAVLGLTRVLERDEGGVIAGQLDLVASCGLFRELAERDQEICRLTALGVSSRELGDRLGMTTRGIELRKQKAFAHLGVSKAVDLARLLTRLQDRGFVDLGL